MTNFKRKYPYFLMFLLLVCGGLFQSVNAATTAPAAKEDALRPWSVAFKTRYFFQSHTSFEFGNPYPPYQAPLSRLEFPLDSWWAGASLRREFFSRFSVGAEVFRNISSEAEGMMTDSDWEDAAQPNIKTIYSESNCRMDPSYIVRADADLKISDWLKLPKWLDLRPAAGFVWQRFSLVTHDGMQYYIAPGDTEPPTPLPGDGIRFEQSYWQFFAGLKADFNLGKPFQPIDLKLQTQMDWAYVHASNEDYHLLREGKRITNDTTNGYAWHALVNLKIGLPRNFSANVGLDYLRISTTGTHRMVNEPYDIDFSWTNGVKVWSEQVNVTMALEYVF